MDQHEQTKSRYLHLTGVKQLDAFKMPKNGEFLESENVILRFKHGLLHADKGPAVQCSDTHEEYWQNGRLHRDNNPAVISDYGKYKEFWQQGRNQTNIIEEIIV